MREAQWSLLYRCEILASSELTLLDLSNSFKDDWVGAFIASWEALGLCLTSQCTSRSGAVARGPNKNMHN